MHSAPNEIKSDTIGLPLPSNDQNLNVICSLTIFAATVLYYTMFQYRIYLIGLSIAFLIVILSRYRSIRYLRFALPIFAFQAYLTTTSFWSPLVEDGLLQSAIDVIFVLFALIPFAQSDMFRKSFSVLFIQAYACALLVCIFINYYTTGEILDDSKGAFRSLFGVVFIVALPMLTGNTILSRSKLSAAILLMILFLGFQLENRVFDLFSIPILIASTLVSFDLRKYKIKLMYPFSALVTLLAVIVTLQVGALSDLGGNRLGAAGTQFSFGDTVFVEANNPSTNSVDVERRLAAQVAIDSFRMFPFFGAGYMSTPFYVGRLTQFETSAHGLPTSILPEAGLFGALLFVVACILSIKGYLLRARICSGVQQRWAYVELVALISALLGGLFHQANHDFYLFLLLGGGLASRRLLRAPLNSIPSALNPYTGDLPPVAGPTLTGR